MLIHVLPDTKDYLWAIKETMARMGEINRLIWPDVNLEERYVVRPRSTCIPLGLLSVRR